MAVQKKFALGRGLDALISTEEVKTAGADGVFNALSQTVYDGGQFLDAGA